MTTPPFTPFYYDDVIGGAVVADQLYAQRMKQEWVVKINNATPKDLEAYLFNLGTKDELTALLNFVHNKLDPITNNIRKFREAGDPRARPDNKPLMNYLRQKVYESNNLGLSELERILKVKAQNLGGDDILELLRIIVMLAILRQLQRQMMGLIG